MKKFVFFAIMFVTLIMTPVMVMAQDVEPPASIIDLLANLNVYLASMIGVAAMTVFTGGLLNGLFQVTSKVLRQIIVWLCAIATMVISNLANIGYGAEFTIWSSLLHGFGAGLIANGLFDFPVVNAIVKFIEALINKPKE
jgi:hypothetical protein